MAHKTLIGGTAYEITGGRTLVNGTGYDIKSGKTLAGGTAYEVGFGKPVIVNASGDIYSNPLANIYVDGVQCEKESIYTWLCPTNRLWSTIEVENTSELVVGVGSNEDNRDNNIYLNGTLVANGSGSEFVPLEYTIDTTNVSKLAIRFNLVSWSFSYERTHDCYITTLTEEQEAVVIDNGVAGNVYAYIVVDGVTYGGSNSTKGSQSIVVTHGASITCTIVDDTNGAGSAGVVVNGTTVLAGAGSYKYTVDGYAVIGITRNYESIDSTTTFYGQIKIFEAITIKGE